ncbi:21302_t:CDS:1, partial [Racocetra persica]
ILLFALWIYVKIYDADSSTRSQCNTETLFGYPFPDDIRIVSI